jgi:adenylate cyclase
VALDPAYARAWLERGSPEAGDAFERALELNPQGGWYALQLAHVAALLRDFPRAERAARQALELQERGLSGREGVLIVGAYMKFGQTRALQGHPAEAHAALRLSVAAFEERLRIGADEPFTRYYAAAAWALLGESERALDVLEAAAAMRRTYVAERARIDPDFENLRNEPRFQRLTGQVEPIIGPG